jgi:hypothetical protein
MARGWQGNRWASVEVGAPQLARVGISRAPHSSRVRWHSPIGRLSRYTVLRGVLAASVKTVGHLGGGACLADAVLRVLCFFARKLVVDAVDAGVEPRARIAHHGTDGKPGGTRSARTGRKLESTAAMLRSQTHAAGVWWGRGATYLIVPDGQWSQPVRATFATLFWLVPEQV